MKHPFILSILLALHLSASAGGAYTDSSHAGTRWWWLGSAVTAEGITWQLHDLASHGIRTVEITPLYGVQGNEQNDIPFLSPRWMEMLRHTVDEGRRIGVEVDMNLGTGWPFGGPTVPLDEAACKLVVVDTIVSRHVADTVSLPPPEKERRYARQIVRRTYKTGDSGKRRVIVLYESRTRQKVKRAAPGGEGWVVDHFDSTAVAHYLERFEKAFAGYPKGSMPAVFFNDSYEVYNADWTPTLLEEFRRRRGYALEDRLPEFLDGDAEVTSDYRETLAELLLQNFTEQWTAWSHRHGVKVRNQAHGSPANLIDVYAAVDIPEIESFGLTDFGIRGLRTDPGFTRRNYSDLTMLKYASSAAHITGKPLTSSETFTWLTEHFRTSLSQMKPDLDLMFCSGVNRIMLHGTCYSPPGEAWPGWKFYASVDMSHTNTIWRDAPELMRYVATCQRRLQSGLPDNDFLVMLPIRNIWRENCEKRLMTFDIHHIDRLAPDFIRTVLAIDSLGYSSDYISERYLLGTTAVTMVNREGRAETLLRTAAGTRYKALVMPEGCLLSPECQRHVKRLKRQGARIITGIDAGAMAEAANAEPMRRDLGLNIIRRRTPDGWMYFVANLTPRDIVAQTTLGATQQTAAVRLRSGESCFYNARQGQAPETFYPIDATRGARPALPLIDLTEQPWTLHFTDAQPAVGDTLRLPRLTTWETLPADSLDELAGTGVYETTFDIARRDTTATMRLELGDVRESARVFLNGVPLGVAWCAPFAIDFSGELLAEGKNTLRIEVTNLPANRIAAYDRRKVAWRKFKEINVVDINYKKTTYDGWQPVPSGLKGRVRLLRM